MQGSAGRQMTKEELASKYGRYPMTKKERRAFNEWLLDPNPSSIHAPPYPKSFKIAVVLKRHAKTLLAGFIPVAAGCGVIGGVVSIGWFVIEAFGPVVLIWVVGTILVGGVCYAVGLVLEH